MGRATPEELKASALDPAEWANIPVATGAGCLECAGSGYHGRAAIAELLDLTDHIREMIINRRPTSEVKRAARESGMSFLRDAGLAKVREGTTTLKEINKVTFIE
jgi:type IV pilus assembly protein PilB